MCYLVAKRFDKSGSIALKTRHGKALVAFTRVLHEKITGRNIQLVTISRPEAYKEYAPYQVVDTEHEFMSQVMTM